MFLIGNEVTKFYTTESTSFPGPFADFFRIFFYMPRKVTLAKQNENHAIY